MRKYSLSLFFPLTLIASSFSGQVRAADFQPLKKGEWKVEVVESSLGVAGAAVLKPQVVCIDEKASSASWEKRMKDELAKTKMDCDFKQLKQDAAAISYKVTCKGTEASAAKNMPLGSMADGVMNVSRENDSSYFMEQDTKASGLALDAATLAKVPAAQRAAVAAVLATQSKGIHIKSKQHYSYVAAICSKGTSKEKDQEAVKLIEKEKVKEK